jgi:pSer/pThr/pTyr-binding forkhead associated (FHA) protein
MYDTEQFPDARRRSAQSPVVARLVITGPAQLSGRSIDIRGGVLSVGRNPSCDVRLVEPRVSGQHARIVADAHGVSVEDIGSTNGTRVNGDPLAMHRRRLLRHGDVVTVASVDLAFVAMPNNGPNPRPGYEANVASYQVRDQRADTVNNVGRDQHNSYTTNNTVDVNPIPSSGAGRMLVGAGLILAFAGFAMFGYAVLDFMGSIFEGINSADPFNAPQPEIKFMPWIPGGVTLAVVGQALVVWGIFLSRAAKRRSQV